MASVSLLLLDLPDCWSSHYLAVSRTTWGCVMASLLSHSVDAGIYLTVSDGSSLLRLALDA